MSPDWFKKTSVYQVNPRTFSREGTIKAVTDELPTLKELGFGIIYLCPIFKTDDSKDKAYWSPRQIASNTENPKNPYRMVNYFEIDGHCYDAGPDSNWNENRCRGGIFHHDLTPKKAALALKKLITEDWHTSLTLTTDKEGYIDFRGFFGEYIVETENSSFQIGIHKNEDNRYEIMV